MFLLNLKVVEPVLEKGDIANFYLYHGMFCVFTLVSHFSFAATVIFISLVWMFGC